MRLICNYNVYEVLKELQPSLTKLMKQNVLFISFVNSTKIMLRFLFFWDVVPHYWVMGA